MNELDLLETISLYIGMGGLVLGIITALLCGWWRRFKQSLLKAQWISKIFTSVAAVVSILAIGGFSTWIWVKNYNVSIQQHYAIPSNLTTEQIITVYRQHLANTQRTVNPLRWAMLRVELGTKLWQLGQRQLTNKGTEYLHEAVVAYQDALQEFQRMPKNWAITNNLLGNALRTLGQRTNQVVILQEAIVAYQAALKAYSLEPIL
ncbi:hypothetical protein TI03_05655 [Achromatium sp. WMS1]|nr:hypothetical protein TI03_05655 [Achromatium sp. WMS1]